MEPDALCLPAGVTTAVDLGSAGADNLAGLRRFIVEAARTRVIPFLHVASIGLVNQGVGSSGTPPTPAWRRWSERSPPTAT